MAQGGHAPFLFRRGRSSAMPGPVEQKPGTGQAAVGGAPVTLTIEKLTYRGAGLGRSPEGVVTFVPYAAPGDVAEVRVIRRHGHFDEAQIALLVSPAAERIAPACPYFAHCGGCQWQHLTPEAQARWKEAIVRELLAKLVREAGTTIRPIRRLEPAWRYRTRAQIKVAEAGHGARLGFYRAGSHEVVDIAACPLLHPTLDRLLAALRAFRTPPLPRLLPGIREVRLACAGDGSESVVAVVTERGGPSQARLLYHELARAEPGLRGLLLLAPSGPGLRPLAVVGRPSVHALVGGARLRVGATAFFQVNDAAAEMVLAAVRELLGPAAGLRLLDLFCGVGTFAVPLGREAAEVTGVEADPHAAADARHNLIENGVAAGRIVTGPVESAVEALRPGPDRGIVDPPRAGLTSRAADAIVRLGIPRLVYVSCDPSTLARDLLRFVRAGYACPVVQPLDLFPQTYHIEAVARLEHPGASP